MAFHAFFLAILISSVGLSVAQTCGSSSCSQEYANTCGSDMSCRLYDNCKTSQSRCSRSIGQPQNLKVDCYDTCIKGHFFRPSIPRQCCANSIILSETIATSQGENFLVARLYSPNEPGTDVYRLNTFCKYNVQCPSKDYVLHYFVIAFDIEPPDSRGNCLDFLRYHFTATGKSVSSDACGKLADLPPHLKAGVHGSGLTLDFRSNRLNTGGTVLVSLSCTKPQTYSANIVDDQDDSCTPSMGLGGTILRELDRDDSDDGPSPGIKGGYSGRQIIVSRKGMVRYMYRTVFVIENGRITHRFRNIRVLHVYNAIEGNMRYVSSARPRYRRFPGYGILRIGRGYAQYNQTLAEPYLLLNDMEEMYVRLMYSELLKRGALDNERFYFTAPKNIDENDDTADCSVNEVAQLNRRSCTPAVSAAANFFIDQDTSTTARQCNKK